MSAEDDATHICNGEKFVSLAHHADAHAKIKALKFAGGQLLAALRQWSHTKYYYAPLFVELAVEELEKLVERSKQ